MDDDSLGQGLPGGDTYNFSDDDEGLQHSHHGSIFSTLGSADMGRIGSVDRSEYSDEGKSSLSLILPFLPCTLCRITNTYNHVKTLELCTRLSSEQTRF